MSDAFALWVYLTSTPLLWLTLTLSAWLAADYLSVKAGRHPLVNPVLIAIAIVSVVLLATGTSFEIYFEGAQFVHFLLGPAIVATAVPLVASRAVVRSNLVPLAAALVVGSIVAILSVVWLGKAFGLPETMLLSLLPKSVTAGVAMGIAEEIGGTPSLAAVLVMLTGMTGALIVTPLMNAMRIKDFAARGFSAGLTSHGIGMARAFSVDPMAGLFASLAMGLNALLTSLIAPVLAVWLI